MQNAFSLMARAFSNYNRGRRVFDWDKAARLIVQKSPEVVDAGLLENFTSTADTIYKDGKPRLEHHAYLASTWATPVIYLDDLPVRCSRMDYEGWSSEWPESALAILKGK